MTYQPTLVYLISRCLRLAYILHLYLIFFGRAIEDFFYTLSYNIEYS